LDDVVGELLQRVGVVGVFDNGNRRNVNQPQLDESLPAP
jgi:hypothetical protein